MGAINATTRIIVQRCVKEEVMRAIVEFFLFDRPALFCRFGWLVWNQKSERCRLEGVELSVEFCDWSYLHVSGLPYFEEKKEETRDLLVFCSLSSSLSLFGSLWFRLEDCDTKKHQNSESCVLHDLKSAKTIMVFCFLPRFHPQAR